MNDTPGWASPGSAPSDGQSGPDQATPGPARPADRPSPAEPAEPAGEPARPGPAPGPKWSKEQPPPGQWPSPGGPQEAPPQAPPPPPGPGWGGPPAARPGAYGGYGQGPGGQPGWGGGWGGPPPAAKPGVIPLRPLGVGEVLDGAVSTMRTHWRTVLGISLTVAVLTQIAVILLQGFVLDDSASTDTLNDPSATAEELTRALGDTLLNSGVILLVTLLGTILATALLTTVTSRAVLGRSVTTAEAWQDARPQLLKLVGLTFLLPLIAAAIGAVGILPGVLVGLAGGGDAAVALAVLGGLAAAVVALWTMVRLSLASAALMLEKQGVVKALSRSAKLVRGSWWRVFGIQLLATIIANIIASIIVIPFTFLASALSDKGLDGFLYSATGDLGWTFLVVSGVGSVIGSMLTFPITAGVTVLLYIDQRIRREALDLDLARAAGVQDHGAVTPGSTPGS